MNSLSVDIESASSTLNNGLTSTPSVLPYSTRSVMLVELERSLEMLLEELLEGLLGGLSLLLAPLPLLRANLDPLGIITVFNPASAAASIFSFMPPTNPIMPPEFIVPVIATLSSTGRSIRTAAVRTVIAAPALGPPTMLEPDVIV